jgi:ATP-dependent Clp protease ATP-binding subunit ClpX
MANLCCSFCFKSRDKVAKLIAGPAVHICDACIGLCQRLLTGKTTAAFASWDSLSDEEFLATVPAAADAVHAAEDTLRDHVDMLRKRGISWDRIAGELGVTRQAAWERFSTKS